MTILLFDGAALTTLLLTAIPFFARALRYNGPLATTDLRLLAAMSACNLYIFAREAFQLFAITRLGRQKGIESLSIRGVRRNESNPRPLPPLEAAAITEPGSRLLSYARSYPGSRSTSRTVGTSSTASRFSRSRRAATLPSCARPTSGLRCCRLPTCCAPSGP